MIANAFLMAVRQIGRNLMRSTLTTLGILIGVAAVIAMVALGRGATQRVQGDLASLGHNLLFVVPGGSARGPSEVGARLFNGDDATAILREVPGLAGVAPTASKGVVAVAGDARWRTVATGSDDAYLPVLSWRLAAGRSFNVSELRSGASVCVLGERVRRELFGAQDALGAAVRLGKVSCRVVGTLTPKGQSTFGQDQDNFVLLPLRTFQRRISGAQEVGVIFVSAQPGADTTQIKAETEALMRIRRHIRSGDEDDFTVRDMKEIAALVGGITGVLTALLAAIASVSLLVGGIGIMNIMLVAVTERTREIGIRLAIGARGREVMVQFLVESIVLSMLGGVLGVALGLSTSYLATRKLGLPFEWAQPIVLIAFGFATLVGVLFGYFPARKAARLNPIEALRHE